MTSITALPNDFLLPPKGMALIVIDMQRDFVEPGGLARRWAMTSTACAPSSQRPKT